MKRIVVMIVAGIAGLVVGLMMSNAIIRPVISFVVPPDLGVSLGSASIGGAFRIALPWALLVAALAAVMCWFLPRSWKLLTLSLVITAAVLLGSLVIQRQEVARGVRIFRDLTQTDQMFVTIDALHLGRTAGLGLLTLVVSAVGFTIRRNRKHLANNTSELTSGGRADASPAGGGVTSPHSSIEVRRTER